MACKYIRNSNNDVVGAVASNGEDSQLYSSLKRATGDLAKAKNAYEYTRTKKFKDWFGKDWEDASLISDTDFYTDANGEPLVLRGNGAHVYRNRYGETQEIKEASNKINSSNLSLRLENEIKTIALQLTKNAMNLTDSFDVNEYFNHNKDLTSKGLLADEFLMRAFDGVTSKDLPMLREVFAVYKEFGFEKMYESLPEGLNFIEHKKLGRTFLSVYNTWEDVVNPLTGNLERTGWRSRVKEKLADYGYNLKDDAGQLLDVDDTPVRIHDVSRLQESPIHKLSSEGRNILSNIPSVDKLYGLEVDMEMADVYSAVSEATVGQVNFNGMVQQLENMVKYKPKLQPIVDRFKNATAKEQATLFANFAMSYKNFILFKAKRASYYDHQMQMQVSEITTQMFSSNQSDTGTKAIQDWANVSKEYDTPNERALYQVVTDEMTGKESLSVSKKKQAAINKAFDKIDSTLKSKDRAERLTGPVPAKVVEGLSEFLWEMGISYGPTLESTRENLEKYFELGDIRKNKIKTGMPLFTEFMNGTSKTKADKRSLRILKNVLTKDGKVEDIYITQGTLLKRLARISHLFEEQPFGSFISGTNKQYWPINQPTPLDELGQIMKSPEMADALLLEMMEDPMYSPQGNYAYTSPLIKALQHKQGLARDVFKIEIVDSYKNANESVASTDYENQSEKISLIVRLNAFANRGKAYPKDDSAAIIKIAVPTQADRKRLDFVTLPKFSTLNLSKFGVTVTRQEMIEGVILQDLSRMAQANKQINDAIESQNFSELVEGYHYFPGEDPSTGFSGVWEGGKFNTRKRGTAFTMTQIQGVEDSHLEKNIQMSDAVHRFLNDSENNAYKRSPEGKIFKQLLAEQVEKVEAKLKKYEQEVTDSIKDYKINLGQDVDSRASLKKDFVKDFVFNDFMGRIELNKLYRGGMSYSKNSADFYKRAGLLNTPGTKLFIAGTTDQGGGTYGMMPTYKETVIRDFDFQNTEVGHRIADKLYASLVLQGVEAGKAENIANSYRPKSIQNPYGINKTDAQGFISIDMYKGIMMGLGKWDTKLDGEAYRNEIKGIGFKTQNGKGEYIDRPIYPVKPYHEELKLDGGKMTMYMNKNSYVTVTKELAANMPQLEKVRQAMSDKGIHVVNVESATKGARKNVLDLQAGDSFDNATIATMDSTKLRLPQIYTKEGEKKITFAKQIRKNIITNLDRSEGSVYMLDGEQISGNDLYNLYQETVATNIKEDTKTLNKSLKLKELDGVTFGTKEYGDAKLEHLKTLRDRMREQITRKDLPQNYLNALNIVPEGQHNWRFEIPLSFPNYQAKFEQIFFGIYNNEIFTQKMKGVDLIQIAEIGGSGVDGQNELKFYDGENMAEVKVRASALGLPPGTRIEDVHEDLLKFVAYRTPNQGKNSALSMKVVEFLPESHAKAIMVPGSLTVQMGADFDIDKLSIILPNTHMVDGVLTKIKPDYSKKDLSSMTTEERNNIILDIFESVLMDPKHLEEVVTPLDSERLSALAEELSDMDTNIDYNHPLAELKMESRNKGGVALRGLWANQLAGRNVAQTTGNMSIHEDFAPIFVYGDRQVIFGSVGKTREYNPNTGLFDGAYTDYNISMYLSAAVDAAKDPIQIDLNDNTYTVPIAGLMLGAGVPVEDVVYYLAQPSIKDLVKEAKLQQIPLEGILSLIPSVAKKGVEQANIQEITDILSSRTTSPMDSAKLRDLENTTPVEQAEYLSNFSKFFRAGRQLQTIYKIITPDNLSNVNEMSSLSSWLDTENRYLYGTKSEVIQGADALVRELGGKMSNPLNAIALEYRGIFDTMLKAAENVGFISNRASFYNFKKELQTSLGKHTFNPAQHKFIDKMLFLDIMTRPESPFVKSKLISKEVYEKLYTNPTSNIITRLDGMKRKYPKLAVNPFVELLQPDTFNQKKGNGTYLIKMETVLESSSNNKNIISKGLLEMVTNPEKFANNREDAAELKEITNFAKILVANQLYTKGFTLGAGTYMDLIPSEFFNTNLLFPQKNKEGNYIHPSPVSYYNIESQRTTETDYFTNTDFINTFVRNFGTLKPGGTSLMTTIQYKNGTFKNKKTNRFKETIMFQAKDDQVWDKDLGYTGYFVTRPVDGDPLIYVRTSVAADGTVGYQMLQLAGLHGKLSEVGVTGPNESAVVTREGDARVTLSPNKVMFSEFGSNKNTLDLPSFVSKPLEDRIDKICKI